MSYEIRSSSMLTGDIKWDKVFFWHETEEKGFVGEAC